MDIIAIYLSDTDDSDTENDTSHLRYRSFRDQSNIFKMPDTTFLKLFRLSMDAVKYILSEINDHLPMRARATTTPNIIKLAVTLRIFWAWKLPAKRWTRLFGGVIAIPIIGDSGYPLERWLLTPYRATSEGRREARFNTINSKARNVIERYIGILKSRFQCLLKSRTLLMHRKKQTQIINVITALHNICLHYRVPFDPNAIIVDEETQIDVDVLDSNNENSVDQQIRNSILNKIT